MNGLYGVGGPRLRGDGLPTSNTDLEIRMKRALPRRDQFLGVFPSDELPKQFPPDSGLIINYEPSSMGGSHWTCAFKNRNNEVYYVDSFGLPAPLKIESWLRQHKFSNYTWNPIQFQEITSKRCGEFSVWFLSHLFDHTLYGPGGQTGFGDLYGLSPFPCRENEIKVEKFYLSR
jgi:hypothetical protein